MKNFKLSLVSSCYNSENFLDELAISVFDQNYHDWEWILADDFSEDNTQEKLNELSQRSDKIKIVKPDHKKQIWWNPQLHATGDIVCHLDSDDKILPRTFEKINYYFNLFPEAVLLHFNANKYFNNLPDETSNIFESFKDNVYMTTDNDSFLEGFEKLYFKRTNIFGYLRIFKNLPGLFFPEHEDDDACLSNDGQWLLTLERHGKWITIPRTTYIARDHNQSENYRNWNPKGEAKLVIQEREYRKNIILEYPRNIKYFDDIYDFAESTYLSKLNHEFTRKKVSFINFDDSVVKHLKVKNLFFDQDINFNDYSENVNYFFIKINLQDTPQSIKDIIQKLPKDVNYEINFFSDNVNLHQNNRAKNDNLENIKQSIISSGYSLNWYTQDNRMHFYTNHEGIKILPEIVLEKSEGDGVYKTVQRVEKVERDYLKIMQIHVGCGLEIPPKKYGGLEEVVHQYMRVAKNRGHEVKLKWLDDVTQNDLEEYDVFHNHTGGFYDLVKDRCIPYIFTMHDAFAKIHGKSSHYYMTNNETIRHSLFSLIPTEDMIDWFLYPEKLRRLHHGVDTNFFYPIDTKKEERLICVGSGDDRKGFHFALEAAHKLGLPITIVGPDSIHDDYNKKFYEIVDKYKKDIDIELSGNVDKDELKSLLNQHQIMIHPASLETGQPCLAVLEAMACGIPVVGTMQDKIDIKGFELCTREIDSIVDGVKTVLNDYDQYSKDARNFARERDWENIFDELEQYYWEAKDLKYTKPFNMKDRLIFSYENTLYENNNIFDLTIKPNPYLVIRGNKKAKYDVQFIDNDTQNIFYSNQIHTGQWVACTISYFVNWKVIVTNLDTNEIEYEYVHDLKNRSVHVLLDTTALGDTLAWMPAVEEFRKKHKCILHCSTSYKDLLNDSYKNITFHELNSDLDFCEFYHRIGFFQKGDLSPVDMRDVSLQNLCAEMLGVSMKEKPCNIVVKEKENELTEPYVCIATQSTAQAKYWNYKGGWQKVVDFLKDKGYNVVCIDKHQSFGKGKYFNYSPENVIGRHERTLDHSNATLNNVEFFIGLGSGLSWLAWSLKKHVIMISGFSHPKSEFTTKCIRIHNEDDCNSCYNRHIFDRSKWLWCPDHMDTDRMFECTKNIKPEVVFDAIDNVIKLIGKNDKNN